MTDDTFKLNIDGQDIEAPKHYPLIRHFRHEIEERINEYRLPLAMVHDAIVAAE